ncbi:MAG: ABC transporter permease [Spirochaetota bacterium]
MEKSSADKYREFAVSIIIVVLSLMVALILGAFLFAIAGANPFRAYSVMLTQPLSGMFGLTEMMVRAAPLMLVGLGIAIAFRSGILNIGGEGQIMLGVVVGTAVGLALPNVPKPLLVPVIFLSAFLGGGIWGGIAGWMRAYLNVNEILSTVMLNYIAIQVYLYLLRGPMIDPNEVAYGTGVPQTALLSENAWLARYFRGFRLHSGLLIAIALAVIVFLFLWKTTVGYRMRAVGAEPKAATYSGMNVKRNLVLAMVLSGGFAGLAGAVEVLGVHHRALESISAGYGFSGIVVALFGGLHPLGIIPASMVFGLLIVGADMMQRAVDVPASIILSIQGLIIMAIVSSNLFLRNPKLRNRVFKLLGGGKTAVRNPEGGRA